MLTLTKRYDIEILDKPFEIKGKQRAEKCVHVQHFNEIGQITESNEYGFVDVNTVYEWIKDGKNVDLSFSYVKDFSLHEYRSRFGIPETDYVEIKELKATSAFFDCTKATDFSYSKFTNSQLLSFRKARFGDGDLNFFKAIIADCDIDFTGADFGNGNINFQFTDFGNGSVSFEKIVHHNGNTFFVNSNFRNGGAIFKDASFGEGNVDFHYAKFGDGDVTFDKAHFQGGNIDFRRVEFGTGKVEFRRVNFGNGNVNFEEVEFGEGKINFKSAEFGSGKVSFEMADFGKDVVSFEKVDFGTGNVSFHKCNFHTLNFTKSLINSYMDLRVEKGHTINLSNTVVRDVIDLIPIKADVDIEHLYLTGMRNLGRIFMDWDKNQVYKLICSQPDSSLREKAEQFNLLKADFNDTGKYNDEDKAYVEFKRFELQAYKKEKLAERKINALWVYPECWFQWLVFDKVGVYATNPVRVIFASVITTILFALIYEVLPMIMDAGIACGGSDNETLGVFARSFYYSCVTFLTIGYGDCLPSGIVHWLAPIEGWMGVFLMSYFTVAFVRKILR